MDAWGGQVPGQETPGGAHQARGRSVASKSSPVPGEHCEQEVVLGLPLGSGSLTARPLAAAP